MKAYTGARKANPRPINAIFKALVSTFKLVTFPLSLLNNVELGEISVPGVCRNWAPYRHRIFILLFFLYRPMYMFTCDIMGIIFSTFIIVHDSPVSFSVTVNREKYT